MRKAKGIVQEDKASEFYWVCRNGNIDRVREHLRTIPYNELNWLEPNGSTPLHAASYHSNADIVCLFLSEYGCLRDHLNRYGLTTFEEAHDEEIHLLFYRPNEDENIANKFELIVKVDDDDNNEEFHGDRWLKEYPSFEAMEEVKKEIGTGKTLIRSTLCEALTKTVKEDISGILSKN